MRLAAFDFQGSLRIGEVSAEGESVSIFELDEDVRGAGVLALLDVWLGGKLPSRVQGSIPLADVRLKSPIPRPFRNIFCVGKNCYEHAHEFSSSGFD